MQAEGDVQAPVRSMSAACASFFSASSGALGVSRLQAASGVGVSGFSHRVHGCMRHAEQPFELLLCSLDSLLPLLCLEAWPLGIGLTAGLLPVSAMLHAALALF